MNEFIANIYHGHKITSIIDPKGWRYECAGQEFETLGLAIAHAKKLSREQAVEPAPPETPADGDSQ